MQQDVAPLTSTKCRSAWLTPRARASALYSSSLRSESVDRRRGWWPVVGVLSPSLAPSAAPSPGTPSMIHASAPPTTKLLKRLIVRPWKSDWRTMRLRAFSAPVTCAWRGDAGGGVGATDIGEWAGGEGWIMGEAMATVFGSISLVGGVR